MKKKEITVLMLLLCMVATVSAENILWVSSGTAYDQGYIDVLESEGYTVDRMPEATVMTEAKRDQANAYDLVIVGRDLGSGDYANTGEVELWNSITAPMILTTNWLTRSNRWKWLDTDSTFLSSAPVRVDLATDDPLYVALFNGVTLDEGNTVRLVENNATLNQITHAGNGTLIATRDWENERYVWIAYWQQGLEFYTGSGMYANGPRMAFASGHIADSSRGAFNLTPAGTMIFLNAVYEMSGATFDRPPFVSAENLIANAGQPTPLNATAFDPDSALTISWTQITGPGTATFDDASIADPNVTFDAKGTYVLEISVTDGTTTALDQITAFVRDNADNALIAHWDFEALPEPNSLTDITGNGFTGIYYSATEPNVVAGNMFGGSQAADLTAGDTYWEVPNSYDNTDPNFNDLSTGMTVAAWVNNTDTEIFAPMIVGNGLDGWRLGVNNNAYNLVCHDIGLDMFTSGINPFDGLWHHVVGVFDGVASQAHIYVDGALVVSRDIQPGTLFSRGDDYPMIQIANRGDAERPWKGYIDDIRVFNYPLTDVDIETLASEGDRAVSVSAGDDQTVAYKGVPVQLAGQLLIDDGVPAHASLAWTAQAVPAGVDPNDVIISDDTIAAPVVTFPNVEGTYILRLTADDTVFTDSDDVNIVIQIPSCADVIAEGLGLAADISGPADTPDCRVDIHDFAAMASSWLLCNDPEDAECLWPYQQ